jgi:Fur family peroxide stress response transcriptional regulator
MTETTTRRAQVIDKLRQDGHRVTPQRMAVLDVLLHTREHPTVEQIYEQVRAEFPMTSLATIYKTVTVLKEMGEVLELGSSGGSNRYDGNPHPHPHLICVECQSITDVEMSGLEDLPREVAQRTGYRIVGHQFDFFGVCPGCQENSDKP